jgi:V/A-type H+-transporting ATPase subunit B
MTRSCCSLVSCSKKRFMDFNVDIPLDEALDLSWQTLAECFSREELLMKDELVEKYYPDEFYAADGEGTSEEEAEDSKATTEEQEVGVASA